MPPRRRSRRTEASSAPSTTMSVVNDCVASSIGAAPRRSSLISNKRTKRAKFSPKPPLLRGGTLQLNEVGERLMLTFLPYLPDRMIAERVCKRWRHLSREEIPIRDLDFSRISMRKHSKSHLKAMLARAVNTLERVVLPGFSLDDASMAALKQHTGLKHMRAYTLSKKQIFELLQACIKLESLELLDCQLLTITRWEPQPTHLRSIRLLACHALRTAAVASMITQCGEHLETLELTGAEYVDSSAFRVMARRAPKLQELTISYSRSIFTQDLQTLVEARCQSLHLLDLSSCSGFSTFPDTIELGVLEVLILDNTQIRDQGLRAIARVGTQLKYLSLQDCRRVTDDGLTELAGCPALELLDLKGTSTTDFGVEALDSLRPSLRMLRLDSCRGVSRSLRLHHGEQTRQFLQRRATYWYERFAVARIATPEQILAAASVLTSESEGDNDSDASYND